MMTSAKTVLLGLLAKHKEKEGTDYLAWDVLKQQLLQDGQKPFGLTEKTTVAAWKKKLPDCFGDTLDFRKKGKDQYLTTMSAEAWERMLAEEKERLAVEKAEKKRLADAEKAEKKRLADAEKKRLAEETKRRQAEEKRETQEKLVHKALQSQSPGKSFSLKVLADGISMSKADFIAIINPLLATGRLQVTEIDTKFGIVGVKLVPDGAKPIVSQPSVASPQPSGPGDDELFRAAVEKRGQGPRLFVEIGVLRRELGWSAERFDAVLRQLRGARAIQLHGADKNFTPDEVKQFFRDEYGSLHASLTWEKQR